MEFKQVHAAIGKAVRRHYPAAEAANEWNIDGWTVKVQELPADWKGTASPTHLCVLPVERKNGITLHLWDPRNYHLLDDHRADLETAGFKVMVGCLQWNRKADYRLDAVEKVLAASAKN